MMTEIDYLKLKLEDSEKAFDKLHQRHMILLKEQGELEDMLNEQQIEIMELRGAIDYLKTVIRYTIPNQMVADVFKYIGEDYE